MKLAIISDCHWHSYKDFDSLNKDGISSRLSLYYKSLDFVRKTCISQGIRDLINLGDMFESRDQISIPVLHMISKSMNEIKASGIKQYFLSGNHDTWNRNGSIHSLLMLSEYGFVITEPTILTILQEGNKENSVKCNFLPWTEKEEFRTQVKNSEPCDLVFTHRMFADSVMPSGLTMIKGDLCKHLDHTKYKQIFAGHVHSFQKIGEDAYYVGSLLAHSFHDKNSEKGFIIYDSETNTFEFIKNPFSPMFKQVTINTIEELDKVKLEIASSKEENIFYDLKIKLKDKTQIENLKNCGLENTRVSIVSENVTNVRMKDACLLSPETLLTQYCTLNSIDKDIMIVGQKILGEVSSVNV